MRTRTLRDHLDHVELIATRSATAEAVAAAESLPMEAWSAMVWRTVLRAKKDRQIAKYLKYGRPVLVGPLPDGRFLSVMVVLERRRFCAGPIELLTPEDATRKYPDLILI